MWCATDNVSIYGFKLIQSGDTQKTRNQDALWENIPCSIQPAGTEIYTLFLEGIEASRAFVIYIDQVDLDIKNGYMLIDQNGNEYVVRGVPEEWKSSVGRLNHTKVAAERVVKY